MWPSGWCVCVTDYIRDQLTFVTISVRVPECAYKSPVSIESAYVGDVLNAVCYVCVSSVAPYCMCMLFCSRLATWYMGCHNTSRDPWLC